MQGSIVVSTWGSGTGLAAPDSAPLQGSTTPVPSPHHQSCRQTMPPCLPVPSSPPPAPLCLTTVSPYSSDTRSSH